MTSALDDFAGLDPVLGNFIQSGAAWHSHDTPESVFAAVEQAAHSEDYWVRRRVAEALPGLAELDPTRTLAIASRLREDWDLRRWRSDLRRRAVESLVIPSRGDGRTFLGRVPAGAVLPLLILRFGDEVFTAFAVIEAAAALSARDAVAGQQAAADALETASHLYAPQEIDALTTLDGFLGSERGPDAGQLARALHHWNVLVRVAAARNVLAVAARDPRACLRLMGMVAADEAKNVRRTLARERSVAFLVSVVDEGGAELLWSLITDPDDTVRVSTFDLAGALAESHRGLFVELCRVAAADPVDDLAARAGRALAGGS